MTGWLAAHKFIIHCSVALDEITDTTDTAQFMYQQ